MLPCTWREQFQSHGLAPSGSRPVFRCGDQCRADALAPMHRIGHEHAELGDSRFHDLDADAAHDIASMFGEDEFLRLKQLRYLLGRCTRSRRLPHPPFRFVVNAVDQLAEPADRRGHQAALLRGSVCRPDCGTAVMKVCGSAAHGREDTELTYSMRRGTRGSASALQEHDLDANNRVRIVAEQHRTWRGNAWIDSSRTHTRGNVDNPQGRFHLGPPCN